jgi:hypothetical protein
MKPWQLGWFTHAQEVGTRFGEDVRLFHEASGLYVQRTFKRIGGQFEFTEWYLIPGIYLLLGDTIGVYVTGFSPTGPHVSEILFLGEVSAFLHAERVELFAGMRAGQVPLYVTSNLLNYRRIWDHADTWEGFVGFHGLLSDHVGLYGAYSYGRYLNGIRAIGWPPDSTNPYLKETNLKFTQLQMGVTFRF